MKVVGIIGAGAAGLCALHRAIEDSDCTPVVWEHNSQLGGTWVYSQQTGKDNNGYPIHSSMYGSLRTNIPKEVMGFQDFPFKRGGKSFIHHSEVLQYLDEYAEHFSLKPWIKFKHHVDSVEKMVDENGSETIWKVRTRNLEDGTLETTLCNSLCVCTGHYSVPKIPEIDGLKAYKGTTSHSHDYRDSVPFKNRAVVVLGAGASGMDIALEVAKVATQVYLSHNLATPIPSKLPRNMSQVNGIKKATDQGFVLMDDSEVMADDLILCTGYEFSFPFLDSSCQVVIEDNRVKPLYKHMIHTTFPTMAFIGVVFQVLPFPIFDIQVQFFFKVLNGAVILPRKEAMDRETECEYERRLEEGMPPHHFHRLAELQWKYSAQLAKLGGFRPLPQLIESMYRDARAIRKIALTTYKETNYSVTGQNTFESTFGNKNLNTF